MEWALRQAEMVERERVLPTGRGVVQVAMDDAVEPGQSMVQGAMPSWPVLAGLRGRVVRIIPERGVVVAGTATVIAGLAGFGPATVGPVIFLPSPSAFSPALPQGAIGIATGELTRDLLNMAIAGRLAGIFAASARPETIEMLAGTDCTALLDGSLPATNTLPLSIVLAHGFGVRTLKAEIVQVLAGAVGQPILLNPGMAGEAGRPPELLLPLPWQTPIRTERTARLVPGVAVWVKGGEHDGLSGRMVRVLSAGQVFPSGVRARAARIRLESGIEVTLPLANLQRVG